MSRPRRRPAARLAPGTPQCAAGPRTASRRGGGPRGRPHRAARENGGNHDIKNFTRGSRGLLSGARARRAALRRRPALQPGRRRDHLLRRDRDGRLHRLPRRPDQGRDGDLRRHHATRSSCRATSSRATRSSSPSSAERDRRGRVREGRKRVHGRIEPRPSHHGQSQHPGGGQAHVHLPQAPGQLADGGAQRLNLASVPEARAAAAPCRPPAGEAAPRSPG